MSEYKTFSNNEYPKVGEVCIVYRTNALDESKGLVGPTESFFGKFSIEDGIPYWGAGHKCKPIDQWKLVEFKASPKTQAEPPADPNEFTETTFGCATVRCYHDGRTETLYGGKVFSANPKEAQPPADTEKITFKVENGLLVGENSDGGWCVGIPVNEAYDALLDYSRIVAISSQSPAYHSISVSNNLHPLPKDYADNIGIKVSTPAPSNMPWKSWSQEIEQRDFRIKVLEGEVAQQKQYINERDGYVKHLEKCIIAQVDQIGKLESMLKSDERKYKHALEVFAIKDAKITKLQIELQGLNARLNSNTEA